MAFHKHAQTAQTSLSLIGGKTFCFFLVFFLLDASATGVAAVTQKERNGS